MPFQSPERKRPGRALCKTHRSLTLPALIRVPRAPPPLPSPAMTDPDPPAVLTRDQVRRVDRYAIETLGLPGLVLMENAGINAAGAIFDELRNHVILGDDTAAVAVFCGGGNNGGDGYVIARHLAAWGLDPTVYAVSDPAKLDGDAAVNHRVCDALNIPVVPLLDTAALDEYAPAWTHAVALVDAMLGTGFTGTVREPVATVIRRLNTTPGPRTVSIDVPSGLDCDSGEASPDGSTVEADLTVTFVARKSGFDHDGADRYTGRVVVGDIGLPDSAVLAALADAAD